MAVAVLCSVAVLWLLLYLMIFAISSPAYFALTRARISLGIAWGIYRDGLEPKARVKIMRISIRTGIAL